MHQPIATTDRQMHARRKDSPTKKFKRRLRGLRRHFARSLLRLAFTIAKGGKKPYEPIQVGGRRYANIRDSEERWQAIASMLQKFDVHNVLDVGCAEGWFVRRAALECNCFALGIEASDRVLVGELSRLYDDVERLAIMKARVDTEDLYRLPKFDAVICLSVVHHIIRADGLSCAEEFIRAVASRAEKLLIFEIGTVDETSWASVLPEQPQGQEAFVVALLERCGLQSVQLIGQSAAYHREVPRLLFSAEPA